MSVKRKSFGGYVACLTHVIFRDAFNTERKKNDKMNRKAKRAYQLTKQTILGDVFDSNDSRDFWEEIGNSGCRKTEN